MKKITLLLALIIGVSSYAQDEEVSAVDKKHEVKLGGIKLLAGAIAEGTYEYVQSKDFSFGASVLYNFDQDNDYPEDFSITPFARFYFQESKEYGAKGFFVEGFGKYVMGHSNETTYDPNAGYSYTRKEDFNVGAVGLALGKKWINKSGFVLELLLGAGRTLGGNEYAPDAFFRGDLNIGYRF
ncbi:hypothetical protein V1389_12345 [Flavobacterium rakeshii]|uniref:hypothetical protein n=1 Tax=Flavobacterium rakeshii TaxID=1038845 RepID=UPI002E7B898D|nr:hypothetical protein [Flavobacterium rakeshii]MEE1899135.1 hypothetical protein [Flavobacterium rakeshii]